MNNKIICIFKKELRELFRDKKSLSMMLITPILIPLIIFGMSALFDAQMNKPVEDYNRIGFNYKMSDAEKEIAKNMDIQAIYGDTEDLREKYDKAEIDLYVTKKGNTYTINGEENETTSMASALVNSYFTVYKESLQKNYLAGKNMDSDALLNIITVKENIATEENFFGNYITNYAFLFIIMAIAISAMYPATDTTAGEKERGTLETLLTFPMKGRDIIVGKYLSVTFSSIVTGIFSFILTVISLKISNNMFEIYNDTNLMLSPAEFAFAAVVIITYSFLISGLNIAVASKCKTFKEAQSALTPVMFISFFPGMIAFLINLKTNALLSLVPFLNFTLIFTDITKGSINYTNILLMLISTITIICIVLGIIIRQYKSEKILFTN